MDEEAVSQTQDDTLEQLDQSASEEHLNEEQVEETSENTEEESTDEETEEEADLSPRQQKRVDQIEDKAKELKLNKILDRIQSAPRPYQQNETLDYRSAIEADDTVYQTLEQDRSQYGDARYNEGLELVKAMEFRTNIKLDLPLVKEKLDKLDPADAEAIDKEYLMYTGYNPETGFVKNPEIGYADFVEAQIERAERLASNLHVASQKNIAKQAAKTGVRPDGGTRSGIKIQNPGDISKLTPEQFEKNREAIYKQLGMEYRK
jgi:hypothetical protein